MNWYSGQPRYLCNKIWIPVFQPLHHPWRKTGAADTQVSHRYPCSKIWIPVFQPLHHPWGQAGEAGAQVSHPSPSKL